MLVVKRLDYYSKGFRKEYQGVYLLYVENEVLKLFSFLEDVRGEGIYNKYKS